MDSELVLKIGTWNVQYGRGAEKNATRLGLLLAQDVDGLALTETHDELDLSPQYTSATTTSRYTREVESRWTTIWTRRPIVEHFETRDRTRTLAAAHVGIVQESPWTRNEPTHAVSNLPLVWKCRRRCAA